MFELLLLSCMLEFGYQPKEALMILDNDAMNTYIEQFDAWYVDISPRVSIGPIYGEGEVKVFSNKSDVTPWFSPYQAEFLIELGATYGPFSIGSEHMCSHSFLLGENIRDPIQTKDASYTRFFARVKFATGGK